MERHLKSDKAGFTLIELLVVISLIAILAGAVGLSMREGSPSAALRSGQSTVVGMLSSARGQAVLAQQDAMIVVDVTDAGSEDYLRSIQVVVRAGTGLDQWRPVGTPTLLPKGIYLVPPTNAGLTAVTLTGFGSSRKSQGFQTPVTLQERAYDATSYPYHQTGVFTGKTFITFVTFSPLGTTSAAGSVLLTSGKRTEASTITMDNPNFIRGVYVSSYGVPTLVNEADTFDKVVIP